MALDLEMNCIQYRKTWQQLMDSIKTLDAGSVFKVVVAVNVSDSPSSLDPSSKLRQCRKKLLPA